VILGSISLVAWKWPRARQDESPTLPLRFVELQDLSTADKVLDTQGGGSWLLKDVYGAGPGKYWAVFTRVINAQAHAQAVRFKDVKSANEFVASSKIDYGRFVTAVPAEGGGIWAFFETGGA
jgi:hypothetical protein